MGKIALQAIPAIFDLVTSFFMAKVWRTVAVALALVLVFVVARHFYLKSKGQ